MDLQEIIVKAIPAETCPVRNAGVMYRRELLKKRINEYIADQLTKQFDSKSIISEFEYGLGGSGNGRDKVQ